MPSAPVNGEQGAAVAVAVHGRHRLILSGLREEYGTTKNQQRQIGGTQNDCLVRPDDLTASTSHSTCSSTKPQTHERKPRAGSQCSAH